MRYLAVAVMLAFLVPTASATLAESPRSWVQGKWVLCHDPDHGPKDLLVFGIDESARLIKSDGSVVPLSYKVNGNTVFTGVTNMHLFAPYAYEGNASHDQLLRTASATGARAIYVRAGTQHLHKCSVR